MFLMYNSFQQLLVAAVIRQVIQQDVFDAFDRFAIELLDGIVNLCCFMV